MTSVQRSWKAEAGKVDLGVVLSGLIRHADEVNVIL